MERDGWMDFGGPPKAAARTTGNETGFFNNKKNILQTFVEKSEN